MPYLADPTGNVFYRIDDASMETPILFADLPPALLARLVQDTDALTSAEGPIPDHDLSGRIERREVPALAVNGEAASSVEELLRISRGLAVELSRRCFGPEVDLDAVQVKNAWVVSQREQSINTVHNHPPHHLSAIAFLCRPAAIDKSPCGYTSFIDGRSGMDVPPRPGWVCVFPSTLKHLVYPFYGEGERRTISINFAVDHPAAARLWGEQPREVESGGIRWIVQKGE